MDGQSCDSKCRVLHRAIWWYCGRLDFVAYTSWYYYCYYYNYSTVLLINIGAVPNNAVDTWSTRHYAHISRCCLVHQNRRMYLQRDDSSVCACTPCSCTICSWTWWHTSTHANGHHLRLTAASTKTTLSVTVSITLVSIGLCTDIYSNNRSEFRRIYMGKGKHVPKLKTF